MDVFRDSRIFQKGRSPYVQCQSSLIRCWSELRRSRWSWECALWGCRCFETFFVTEEKGISGSSAGCSWCDRLQRQSGITCSPGKATGPGFVGYSRWQCRNLWNSSAGCRERDFRGNRNYHTGSGTGFYLRLYWTGRIRLCQISLCHYWPGSGLCERRTEGRGWCRRSPLGIVTRDSDPKSQFKNPSAVKRALWFRLVRYPSDSSTLSSISTRRFFRRPSAVLFVAIGFSGPNPSALILAESTPLPTRYVLIVLTRNLDTLIL